MIRPYPVEVDQLEEAVERTHRLRLVDAPRPRIVIEDRVPSTNWKTEIHRRRGEALLDRLERAIATGARRREARLRRELLGVIHQDRIAHACALARGSSLRLEPVGWGELLTEDATYRLRRSPWRVTPIAPGDDVALPERARAVFMAWTDEDDLFDGFYLADEVREGDDPALGNPGRPESYLVGAISKDGRNADWFVLDRWPLMAALR